MKTFVLHFRVAQNWEFLEKLTSLDGSVLHLGHMKIKKYFLKILFIFATPLPLPPHISHYESMGHICRAYFSP